MSFPRHTREKESVLSAFSNGVDILLPKTRNSADIFMFLFHEIGHNIDQQFNIQEVMRPIEELKTATIFFSDEEAQWLLKESAQQWRSLGISQPHLSILKKILDVILIPTIELERNIQQASAEEFFEIMKKTDILASQNSHILDKDSEDSPASLTVTDEKLHRNSEVPANFVMEIMFDILNRSINKHFCLSDDRRVLAVYAEEKNLRTIVLARYLFKRNWKPPGFLQKNA